MKKHKSSSYWFRNDMNLAYLLNESFIFIHVYPFEYSYHLRLELSSIILKLQKWD